ncbi:MAG: ergothioneine biosynthesis protein EgtB [Rubrivivax sp.]|nr:ergothioneine biosynthesis protein EgtB [Rubrivivax sp.]
MSERDSRRSAAAPSPSPSPEPLAARYAAVRAQTEALAAGLSEADCQVQSMPDASPVKWHLAHVTWFFETFVLEAFEAGFRPHHPAYRVLFNSYYQAVGERHPRPQRGLVTRPSLAEVLAWRRAVDDRVQALLHSGTAPTLAERVELGLQHEQQHQELLLTDLLHLFSCNPLAPVYRPLPLLPEAVPLPLAWVPQQGGLTTIGHAGDGFAFDNETPRHRVYLQPCALANRLTTQGEWADFVADAGYRDPRWWLAAGWDWVQAQGIEAPLYWRRAEGGRWEEFTLHGQVSLAPHAPVVHVSLYEADAYARWAAAEQRLPLRLPTEAEWEHAAAPLAAAGMANGNFVESQALQTLPVAGTAPGLLQMYGDVWEWTRSAYLPYPGFRVWAGAVGEYNGKFMIDQTVLRGGSCATPRSHIRASYRNFFPAGARWQFSGVRLACDAE